MSIFTRVVYGITSYSRCKTKPLSTSNMYVSSLYRGTGNERGDVREGSWEIDS